MSADRRRHPRFPMGMAVALTVAPARRAAAARLLDLSQGGCYLETDAQVPVGTIASLSFALRSGQACVARGIVVRLHEAKGFGVQFEETNEGLDEFLRDLGTLREDLRPGFIGRVLDPSVTLSPDEP